MPRKKKITRVSQTSLFGEEDTQAKRAVSPKKKKTEVLTEEIIEQPQGRESAVFSVADYLTYLGDLVSAEGAVVQGEISGYKTHPAGAFFSLKDQDGDGLLRCYMPPRYLHQLGFDLEDGLLVQATGVASIYRPRGELSFSVSSISLVGDGSIRQAYEALKKKLEEEGLFTRKRELPEFIHRVGLVTAKTGEVIHDFQTNLRPLGFEVELMSVRVQGADAPPQIVEAIKTFNHRQSVEIIIVMRGGGSLEDLQAFNDERVARAIFKSNIPILAAIGHDRDVPIASLTADRYVSTPSIAAITVNRSWERLEDALPMLKSDLLSGFEEIVRDKKIETGMQVQRLLSGMGRLFQIPQEFRKRLIREVQSIEQRVRDVQGIARREIGSIVQSLQIQLRQAREFLDSSSTYLEGVSPERNLKLGYSIVTNSAGRVIKGVGDITQEEEVQTLLNDGSFLSKVIEVNKRENNDKE